MRVKKLFVAVIFAMCLSYFIGFNLPAKADYLSVLNTISSTANTINSVNRAGRGTMSTVEATQRFTDRQQDRQDRKRAEKSYNASAEEDYYRTLQETQALRNQYYYNNNL